MANDTRIYVNREVLNQKLSDFETDLNQLQDLLNDYESLKSRANTVWGDEDDNKAKAIAACDSAIKVVRQRIEDSKNDKNTLSQLSDLAFSTQDNLGKQIEEAKEITDNLLS